MYTSFTWAIDGQILGNQESLRHVFGNTGTHEVALRVVDSTGHATQSVTTVKVGVSDLLCDFELPASIIEAGQQLKLSSQVSGLPQEYFWKVNGKIVGTNAEVVLAFDKTGDYEVWLEIKRGKAKADSGKKLIFVSEPNVQLAFECPTTTTSGRSTPFVNKSVGPMLSFVWQFGDGQVSTNYSPSHCFTNETRVAQDLPVILRARTVTGKTLDSTPVSVRVLPFPPKAAFRVLKTPPYKVGMDLQFTNLSTGWIDSQLWSFDANTQTGKHAEVTLKNAGLMRACLVVTGPGGSTTNEQKLLVEPGSSSLVVSEAKYTPHRPRLQRDGTVTVMFKAVVASPNASVRWDFGDGATSDKLLASHTYHVAGTYTVRVTARDALEQENSLTLTLNVLPPLPWWCILPLYALIAFVIWALLIVPLLLNPFVLPHKIAILRSSNAYQLHQLAKRRRFAWVWPHSTIKIGTNQTDDIRLNINGGSGRTLAVIKRNFASQDYRLFPLEPDRVKLLEKYLAVIPAGEGRLLRDGDQICLGDETFSWTFQTGK